MKDYLRNGVASRSEIANDIENGTLGKEDIEKLINRDDVVDSFIGSSYPNKVGRDQWTEKYLDKLVLAAIAENFNEDYMYYLYDVAKYVRDSKKKKKGYIKILTAVVGKVRIILVIVVIALIVMAIRKCLTGR